MLDVILAHQQRTRGRDDRRSTHAQIARELVDLTNDLRFQRERRGELVASASSGLTRCNGMSRWSFSGKIANPVVLIIEKVGGSLVFQLRLDQILQRAEERGRNLLVSSGCGIDSCDPVQHEAKSDSVNRDVMAACEEVILICASLHQCEFEQWAGKRHRRSTYRRRQAMNFLCRILRVCEVKTKELDVRIFDEFLKNLVIFLEENGSKGFSLIDDMTDRPFN
ncbi:hypothetical protein A5650_20000 [Mycobacterium sp. 1164985.4]|nr:hypothetical protein A5650_20000 [Mycobacterium sp. 1164985.4]